MGTIPRPYAHEIAPKFMVLKNPNSVDVTLSFDDVEHLTQALYHYRCKEGATVGDCALSESLAEQLTQAVETRKEKHRKQQEHIERELLIAEARERVEKDYRAPVWAYFTMGGFASIFLLVIIRLIYAQF